MHPLWKGVPLLGTRTSGAIMDILDVGGVFQFMAGSLTGWLSYWLTQRKRLYDAGYRQGYERATEDTQRLSAL